MQKKIIDLFLKNLEIFVLIFFIITIVGASSFFNYQKKINNQKYNNFINNIYLKKTLNSVFNNLEPKFKKVNHKIRLGETFDEILKSYSIDKEEIIEIKKNLLTKFNLNKLNTKQSIQFSLDRTNNKISPNISKLFNKDDLNFFSI